MKIYITSSEKHVGKIQEDIYIRDACIAKGISCEIVTMKDVVDLATPIDVVVIKSIWGYHLSCNIFLEQLADLKKKRVRMVNHYDFIFWNIDKGTYLKDCNGLSVVPTINLNNGDSKESLMKAAQIFDTPVLVVKPSISESGFLTIKCDTEKEHDIELCAGVVDKNMELEFIIQPYRSSVSRGEISLIVIDGRPLYGIKRYPGVFGVKVDPVFISLTHLPIEIKKEFFRLKKVFLKRFARLPKICRVDFLCASSGYEILEVELIDPDLFFRWIPDSIRKKAIALFCDTILECD